MLALLFLAVGFILGIIGLPQAETKNDDIDEAMLWIAQAQYSHTWWLNAIEAGQVSEEDQKYVGDAGFQREWLNRYDVVYKQLQEHRNMKGEIKQ